MIAGGFALQALIEDGVPEYKYKLLLSAKHPILMFECDWLSCRRKWFLRFQPLSHWSGDGLCAIVNTQRKGRYVVILVKILIGFEVGLFRF